MTSAPAEDPVVVLRPAVAADVPLLELWDEDPDVAESGGDDDVFDWAWEVPRSVEWREILVAEADGEQVGVVVLIDAAREETHYWGDDVEPGAWAIDIWIGAADDLGRGYGTTMMRLALARCFADPAVRAVLEMLGIQDCLTKSYGSTNPKNLVKATVNALEQLQTREKIEALRGVTIGHTMVEQAVERGLAAMPQVRTGEKMQAPKNTLGDERRRGRRRGARDLLQRR